MPLLSARRVVVCFSLGFFLASFSISRAQTNYYVANGSEYSIVGLLPGDQAFPDVALNRNGGYVVWQDNITDPVGLGISAMQINRTLSGSGDVFAVNAATTNDQENAHVALLNNGGAAFVWQGGPQNIQHIYARFLNANNVWVTTTNELVSTDTKTFQDSPAVATLSNGNVIVVWDSFSQVAPGSMDDVYGQIFSTNGTRIGTNFLVNVFTQYNQRNPTVAALTNGGFVVAWVSEQERQKGVTNSVDSYAGSMTLPTVDIYDRLYTISGTNAVASTTETLVNEDNNPCARPAVAVASDGSYMVTWCEYNMANPTESWDIFARSFTNSSGGPVISVNSYTYGDQYNPRISVVGGDYFIVWTSLGEDGSREGVYGRFIHENGALIGNQVLVNTTTLGEQMEPAVASDGFGDYLAVWTSFTFSADGFDLFAQRYENVGAALMPMSAPFVWTPFVVNGSNIYQPELVVTWPPVEGLTGSESVSNYEVFVNGSSTPSGIVTGDCWTMTAADGLTGGETNSFQVAYMTVGGFLSPLSPATSGHTWPVGELSYYGIPFDWMVQYYGPNWMSWPSATAPVVPGGPSLLQIFMSGGNPTNSATWLRTSLTHSNKGMYLNWNCQPGMTYQVQSTTDFRNWNNFGAPRFESGTSDSIFVGSGGGGYYRVQLLQP